jgi:hypothetical protein
MMKRTIGSAVMVLTCAASGFAGDDCIEVPSVPYAISSPGRYCFKTSLDYSVWGGLTAVAIDSDDVVLDLGGHVLDGHSSDGLATGILALGRRNVTVRNGTVRNFAHGVLLTDSPRGAEASGYVVEEIQVAEAACSGLRVHGYEVLGAVEDAVFKTVECTHPHQDGVQCNVKTCRADEVSDCSEFAANCMASGHHYSGTTEGGTCTRVL